MNLFPNILKKQVLNDIDPTQIELQKTDETNIYNWGIYTLSFNKNKLILTSGKKVIKMHKAFFKDIEALYEGVNVLTPESEVEFEFERANNATYQINQKNQSHTLNVSKYVDAANDGTLVHIILSGETGKHGFAEGDTFYIPQKKEGFTESVEYKVKRISKIYKCKRIYKNRISIKISIVAEKTGN